MTQKRGGLRWEELRQPSGENQDGQVCLKKGTVGEQTDLEADYKQSRHPKVDFPLMVSELTIFF